MRYDDWDVILFPTGREAKIPFKEFKVACHAIPDVELSHIHGSAGMPVVTCFVPSLPAGSPFQISLHCWRNPEISQFTRTYSKHIELVKYEARILLDGRLVASTVLDRKVNGPHLITSTFEFTKTGELERLKFPHFRRELMFQNHWSPADDIGRIKIIISEGFPRDSLSVPIERVKNVVAFSFQHAPLEILEANGIAWPNPSMWRRPPANPSVPVPTYQTEDGADLHSHSPRRKSLFLRNVKSQGFPTPPMPSNIFQPQTTLGFMGSSTFPAPLLPRTNTASANTSNLYPDPFNTSPAYMDWVNSMNSVINSGQSSDSGNSFKTFWPSSTIQARKHTSDASMPDYSAAMDEIDGIKVPTNTPTAMDLDHHQYHLPQHRHDASLLPPTLASSLTQSLLNQPIPLPSSEIKSRKETRHHLGMGLGLVDPNTAFRMDTPIPGAGSVTCNSSRSSSTASSNAECGTGSGLLGEIEKTENTVPSALADQPVFSGSSRSTSVGELCQGSGVKRNRTFTPASARVIDDEDEPRRASPCVRIGGFGSDIDTPGTSVA
ncbi:hypothetical protein B0T21DRAFT_388100 [Apiosordaria backusii]|uniref:Uncharacterized protein n=1 Tax=Apiosordaria backusii TaxID=314023 RepID=A0AA39ZRW0_9PEZI|nr:hypothetical protein B0T21DRAFT_388100 [Apiosordaria backusii]